MSVDPYVVGSVDRGSIPLISRNHFHAQTASRWFISANVTPFFGLI